MSETIADTVTSEEEDENIDIAEFHPGTVDNPFIYDGTRAQKEQFLLTCVFVAGKNAAIQQKKVEEFVEAAKRSIGSFIVDSLGIFSALHNNAESEESLKETISALLKEVKVGQYSRITKCMTAICASVGSNRLDLLKCNRPSLTALPGIGYKTASFFMLYTRKGWKGACIDTHILKWLRDECKLLNIPDKTPSLKAEYLKVETLFLEQALLQKKPVAQLDFEIWSKYRVPAHGGESKPAEAQSV